MEDSQQDAQVDRQSNEPSIGEEQGSPPKETTGSSKPQSPYEPKPVAEEQPQMDGQATVSEVDSTVNEIPVNLKIAGHSDDQHQQEPAKENPESEEVSKNSSPPPLHHVRTITSVSDYRQQEQENEETVASSSDNHRSTSNEEQHMAANQNANPSMYQVEEGSAAIESHSNHDQQSTNNHYGYQTHHYGDENESRYRSMESTSVKSSGIQQEELLDAAAAAAGVPTDNYIMISGEEDDRTSIYLGSRLASFQVTFYSIL